MPCTDLAVHVCINNGALRIQVSVSLHHVWAVSIICPTMACCDVLLNSTASNSALSLAESGVCEQTANRSAVLPASGADVPCCCKHAIGAKMPQEAPCCSLVSGVQLPNLTCSTVNKV